MSVAFTRKRAPTFMKQMGNYWVDGSGDLKLTYESGRIGFKGLWSTVLLNLGLSGVTSSNAKRIGARQRQTELLSCLGLLGYLS
jgi:hypothetical protein